MRLYALYISFAASFSGCIYGDMDTSTSSSSGACDTLVEAVCRDCDPTLCQEYQEAVSSNFLDDDECTYYFETLLETGC